MVARKKITEQHTAAEVERMTPEEAMAVRVGTAAYQRQVPEHAMMEAQRNLGGGVLPHALEHVGDLPHRMNQAQSTDITMEDVGPKISRQIGNLGSNYGFEREHHENLASNARHQGVPETSLQATAAAHGQSYADAHRGTPVYNFPTEVAVNAAVSLGEGRYSESLGHLKHLSAIQFGGSHEGTTYAAGDMQSLLEGNRHRPTAEHQEAMVDYLRGREASTPGITEAARVMLGGPRS